VTAPTRWFLAAVLVVAALAGLGTLGRSEAGRAVRPAGASLPVTATDLVCPMANGTPGAPLALTVATVAGALPHRSDHRVTTTTTPLTGPKAAARPLPRTAVARTQTTTSAAPLLVAASGPAADTVAADQRRLVPAGRWRGLVSTRCLPGGIDTWLTGADGRIGYTDLLLLANPGTTAANLTVSAWAASGRLHPPKLQSYTLPARRSVLLPVADYAPDEALVTLHVHANSGRVAAAVLDHRVTGIRAAGADWIGPTQPPGTDLVVPGFPGGTGPRRAVVTNPGTRDATVGLRLSTETGNFAPAGHPTLLVRAGHSAAVDLTESFGQAPGALLLHSDAPITASGFSELTAAGGRSFPDFQWQPAGTALDGPAVLPDNSAPFDGPIRLFLTAGTGAAQVRVTTGGGASKTVAIRAGRSVVFDPAAAFGAAGRGPLVITPLTATPVYAARSLFFSGAHGPLATSEAPSPLPPPVRLPPAVFDLRAALP